MQRHSFSQHLNYRPAGSRVQPPSAARSIASTHEYDIHALPQTVQPGAMFPQEHVYLQGVASGLNVVIPMEEDTQELDPTEIEARQTFPYKLFDILENESLGDYVRWLPTEDTWSSFEIPSIGLFKTHILPTYFKITWESFQKQLSNYGFRKIGRDSNRGEYSHWNKRFRKGRSDLLPQVKKAPKESSANIAQVHQGFDNSHVSPANALRSLQRQDLVTRLNELETFCKSQHETIRRQQDEIGRQAAKIKQLEDNDRTTQGHLLTLSSNINTLFGAINTLTSGTAYQGPAIAIPGYPVPTKGPRNTGQAYSTVMPHNPSQPSPAGPQNPHSQSLPSDSGQISGYEYVSHRASEQLSIQTPPLLYQTRVQRAGSCAAQPDPTPGLPQTVGHEHTTGTSSGLSLQPTSGSEGQPYAQTPHKVGPPFEQVPRTRGSDTQTNAMGREWIMDRHSGMDVTPYQMGTGMLVNYTQPSSNSVTVQQYPPHGHTAAVTPLPRNSAPSTAAGHSKGTPPTTAFLRECVRSVYSNSSASASGSQGSTSRPVSGNMGGSSRRANGPVSQVPPPKSSSRSHGLRM